MRLELLCLILSILLAGSVCGLLVWACWFFYQWRCLDAVLEQFQAEDLLEFVRHTQHGTHAGSPRREMDTDRQLSEPVRRKPRRKSAVNADVKETRESRLVHDMRQILSRAAWREQEAVSEKQEVMSLLSDLSHQLKTPLANIILDMDLLESGLDHMDEAGKREFLSHAKAQASTMQWLMQDLLKASRLENGMIRFQAEPKPIRPTIAKAVSAVYAQACGRQMEIRVEEIEDLSLYHNPKWTSEAMANVLENAVKYAPKGSSIRIYMEKMDIYTRITVQDQGPGIAETEYHKIFQRFYRGKQAASREGTGLGLYLAQLIMQSEQGYLTVESKPGQGSRFHFFLLNQSNIL